MFHLTSHCIKCFNYLCNVLLMINVMEKKLYSLQVTLYQPLLLFIFLQLFQIEFILLWGCRHSVIFNVIEIHHKYN